MTSPKVFISYSWDNDLHRNWVLLLAEKLLANGVDVILDQYELHYGVDLTFFMENSIMDSDKVLIILTENYKNKAENREGGTGFEFSLINSELYKNKDKNKKFIPILRGKERTNSTPNFLKSIYDLDMRVDADFSQQFENLLRSIFEKPKKIKPTIGNKPEFLKEKKQKYLIWLDEGTSQLRKDLIQNKGDIENLEILKQINKIRKFISLGNTELAIEQFQTISKVLGNEKLIEESIKLNKQLEAKKIGERLGITTSEEQSMDLARINVELLKLIKNPHE